MTKHDTGMFCSSVGASIYTGSTVNMEAAAVFMSHRSNITALQPRWILMKKEKAYRVDPNSSVRLQSASDAVTRSCSWTVDFRNANLESLLVHALSMRLVRPSPSHRDFFLLVGSNPICETRAILLFCPRLHCRQRRYDKRDRKANRTEVRRGA